MKKHPLISFFLITFLITWGIAGFFFLFPEQVVRLTMKEADAYHPLFRIAASAPTLSAFLVILWLRGKQGLLAFWARYLDFAIRLRWYVFIFGGIVGFGFVLRYLEKSWGVDVPDLSFSWYSFIPFAIYWLFSDPGPLGEEGGWRGFALPLLQRAGHGEDLRVTPVGWVARICITAVTTPLFPVLGKRYSWHGLEHLAFTCILHFHFKPE